MCLTGSSLKWLRCRPMLKTWLPIRPIRRCGSHRRAGPSTNAGRLRCENGSGVLIRQPTARININSMGGEALPKPLQVAMLAWAVFSPPG